MDLIAETNYYLESQEVSDSFTGSDDVRYEVMDRNIVKMPVEDEYNVKKGIYEFDVEANGEQFKVTFPVYVDDVLDIQTDKELPEDVLSWLFSQAETYFADDIREEKENGKDSELYNKNPHAYFGVSERDF